MISSFPSKRILIIGDIMLDRYVYGDVTRISPEAPTQVLDIGGTVISIGAAANCAKNITALGAQVTLISVIGDDEAGKEITTQVGLETGITPYLLTERERRSTIKTRYVSGTYQLLRADWEYDDDIAPITESRVIDLVCGTDSGIGIEDHNSIIAKHDVVVLSDYDKGVLTPKVIKEIVRAAKYFNKPIIIDPKKADWKVYSGATVLTPNLNEWFIASGKEYHRNIVHQKAMDCGIENILVTRSKDGMSLISMDANNYNDGRADIPSEAKIIVDVTGAGDTVVALLALGMASGLSLVEAARLANKAAGIVVGKPRTAIVTLEELESSFMKDIPEDCARKAQITKEWAKA